MGELGPARYHVPVLSSSGLQGLPGLQIIDNIYLQKLYIGDTVTFNPLNPTTEDRELKQLRYDEKTGKWH